MTPEEQKELSSKRLLDAALTSFAQEYRDLADTWRNLEAKAQGICTISGIFLAGALTCYLKILLGIAVIALCVAIVFSIFALRIAKIPFPPIGTTFMGFVEDIIAATEVDPDVVERNFVHDQLAVWENANAAMRSAIEKRAGHIDNAQITILVAILFSALSVLVLLIISKT
jgi:uncharacterized membrane protein YccF (DUF307 family)